MTGASVQEKLDAIAQLQAKVVFDGCHKLYLVLNEGDAQVAVNCGYDMGDFFPAGEIHRLWEDSCPLRFVNLISLEEHPLTIEQFEDEDEEG